MSRRSLISSETEDESSSDVHEGSQDGDNSDDEQNSISISEDMDYDFSEEISGLHSSFCYFMNGSLHCSVLKLHTNSMPNFKTFYLVDSNKYVSYAYILSLLYLFLFLWNLQPETNLQH